MPNYRKPTFWVAAIMVAAAFVLAVGLKANPLQKLFGPRGVNGMDINVPKMTITTPRDSFSPMMSSMFGFELVFSAPENSAQFHYVCNKGSFCTHADGKVKQEGNNVVMANETLYWSPFESDEYPDFGEKDKVSISITALDKDNKIIAFGTAAIEQAAEGEGWFKFTGNEEGGPGR